jgi:hypothetical protein
MGVWQFGGRAGQRQVVGGLSWMVEIFSSNRVLALRMPITAHVAAVERMPVVPISWAGNPLSSARTNRAALKTFLRRVTVDGKPVEPKE